MVFWLLIIEIKWIKLAFTFWWGWLLNICLKEWPGARVEGEIRRWSELDFTCHQGSNHMRLSRELGQQASEPPRQDRQTDAGHSLLSNRSVKLFVPILAHTCFPSVACCRLYSAPLWNAEGLQSHIERKSLTYWFFSNGFSIFHLLFQPHCLPTSYLCTALISFIGLPDQIDFVVFSGTGGRPFIYLFPCILSIFIFPFQAFILNLSQMLSLSSLDPLSKYLPGCNFLFVINSQI